MPTDTVGLNLSQMVELQRALERKAADVEQLTTELGGLIGAGGGAGAVHWQGRVADQFRQDWDSVFAANLRQLSQALHDQARYVDDNRRRANLVLNGVDG